MPEKKKLFLGVILRGSVPAISFRNLFPLIAGLREKFDLQLSIQRATLTSVIKNMLIERVLQTDAEFVLFYDLDLLVSVPVVEKLVEANKDVVSALFFFKENSLPCFKVLKDNKYSAALVFPGDKLFSVDALSVGCLLMKKSVLEKVSNSLKEKSFFDFEYYGRGIVLDEDIYFSRLLKQHGFDLFVDPQSIVPRLGGVIDGTFFVSRYGTKISELIEKQKKEAKK